MIKKVAITGSSSAIGQALSECLENQGLEVFRYGRNAEQAAFLFDLERPDQIPNLSEIDVIIHLAWQRSAAPNQDRKINVLGSSALVRRAQNTNTISILISSDSAEKPRSNYGETKKEVENHFLNAGGYVLRCGVVWGNDDAGILESILRISNMPLFKPRLVPDPNIRATRIDEICTAVIDLLFNQDSPRRLISVGSPGTYSLSMITQITRDRAFSIPVYVPIHLAYVVSRCLQKIGLKLPFDPDSLRSFYPERRNLLRKRHRNKVKITKSDEFLHWLKNKKNNL